MIRYPTLCLSICLAFCAAGQEPGYDEHAHPVAYELAQLKQNLDAPIYSPFITVENQALRKKHQDYVGSQVYLKLHKRVVSEIRETKPQLVSLELPLGDQSTRVADFYRVEFFSEDFVVRTSNGLTYQRNPNLVFYRGIVRGENTSLAILSVLDGELRILISDNSGDHRIQLTDDGLYVSFREDNLRIQPQYNCFVSDDLVINDQGPRQGRSSNSGNCVEIFFECDYKSYIDNNSSVSETEAWATALFNEVSTLYANEMVPVGISEIFVWTEPDPWVDSTSTLAMLLGFKEYRNQQGYNGRLAHLLTTRTVGGGIAWVNVLCSNTNPYGVSGNLSTNIVPFPTYSWSVEVVTHELGHNFGSKHTHACVWNGNNTQIDDCGNEWANDNNNTPEGNSCYDENNPILPDDGTIMSYCHLVSGIGIDFNLGFGPQPGALILDKYQNASCNTGSCTPPLCTQLANPVNGETEVPVNTTLAWNEEAGATGYYLIAGTSPGGGNIVDSVDVGSDTSYYAGILPENSTIYVTIVPYNNVGEATGCAEESFTTGTEVILEYCESQSNQSEEEWIDTFSLGGFENNSGPSTYSDFTELIIDVEKDKSYPVSISMDYAGNAFPEYFRVWIDFNQDGDFDDQDETVFSHGPTTSTATGNITIPPLAKSGDTRIRVSMKWNAFPGACETFSHGEVEDYTLHIRCNTVVSTASEGEGSLRDVLNCVEPGDTVFFASALNGQTLDLANLPIDINKTAVILCEPGQNIEVNGNASAYCFSITNGIQVNIQGLRILSGTQAEGAGIHNNGILALKDITVLEHPDGNDGPLFKNEGMIRFGGNCFIESTQ